MPMTTIDAREQAIRDLTRHCGDGRLTLDELEDRIAEVHAATTAAEIQHALRELPPIAVADEPVVTASPSKSRAYEWVAPDAVLDPPPVHLNRHHGPISGLKASQRGSLERTLRTVWVISGFVAMFNGLWWLALILWFVLPKLVLPNLRRI